MIATEQQACQAVRASNLLAFTPMVVNCCSERDGRVAWVRGGNDYGSEPRPLKDQRYLSHIYFPATKDVRTAHKPTAEPLDPSYNGTVLVMGRNCMRELIRPLRRRFSAGSVNRC